MSVTKSFRERSPLRIHLACGIACGVGAVLAGVAYGISTELVGSAAAHSDNKLFGLRLAMTAPSTKPERSFSVKPAAEQAVKPPVAAKIISYAQATGDTSVVDVSPSTDTDEWAGYEPWTAGRADTYRTVCVRLCDGAYHPISFSTTRSRFKADAARCQASCDQPSKLFVVKPEGSPEDMVDVRGGSYTDLPNAFKFQTSYDAACTCRGQPWEAKAQDRHRNLAAAAQSVVVSQSLAPPVLGAVATTAAPHALGAVSDEAGSKEIASVETGSIGGGAPLLQSQPSGSQFKLASLATEPVVMATNSVTEAVSVSRAVPETLLASPPVSVPTLPAGTAAHHQKRVVAGVSIKESKKVTQGKRLVKLETEPDIARLARGIETKDRDVVVTKRARRGETTVAVLRPLPPPAKRYQTASASSAQRPFRSAEYWRLSFWEPKN